MINYERATAAPVVVAAAVTSGILVAASPKRVGLILTSPLSGTVTYSISPIAVSGLGIVLLAGQHPVILTLAQHGQIVQRQWTLIHSAGGLSVEIYEIAEL